MPRPSSGSDDPVRTRDLGLPLEYREMPRFFDAHNEGETSARLSALVATWLTRLKVRTVLDLTCGTGSQVFYLTEKGFDVVGADFSPPLLEIARKKARQRSMDINFIDGDMRTLQAGRFDGAITMFNAIGHLSRKDFMAAMANIGRNLTSGGIYVFDIFNLAAMDPAEVASLEMDYRTMVGGAELHHRQRSELDAERGLLTSFDRYAIREGQGPTRHVEHRFTLQIYTADELADMLEANGFELVTQLDLEGKPLSPQTSPAIVSIARKIAD